MKTTKEINTASTSIHECAIAARLNPLVWRKRKNFIAVLALLIMVVSEFYNGAGFLLMQSLGFLILIGATY